MKRLFILLLLIICYSCISFKNEDFIVQEDQIECIYITKNTDRNAIELNRKEVKKLLYLLNNANQVGVIKYYPEYEISIYLMNDSIISLGTNKNYFSGKGVPTYSIQENNYFSDLWNKKLHGL